MSLRNMEVQYIGDTLFLPKLEREVMHIIVRNEDVKDWEHFEPKQTCKFVSSKGSDYPPVCSACGYELGIYDCAWYEDGTYGYERHYCPNCGAKVTKYDQQLDAIPATEENMARYGWVREQTCRNISDEYNEKEIGATSFCCSECGAHYEDAECYYAFLVSDDGITHWCPSCGAKVVSE